MNEKTIPDDLITLHEAAPILGRNRESVRRAITEGKLPGWRVMGRLMVSRRDAVALATPVPVPPATPKKKGGAA